MKRTTLLQIVVGSWCAVMFGVNAVSAQTLEMMAMSWPPYVYEENGNVTGLATDVVQAALDQAGIQGTIAIYPTARAQAMLLEAANRGIYPALHATTESSNVKWVGPLGIKTTVAFFKLKKRADIQLKTLEDAKAYRIGLRRKVTAYRFLLNDGFPKSNLEEVELNEQNIKKLFAGRVDLIVDSTLVARSEMKRLGFPLDEIEEALTLFEHELYIALNKDTPDETIQRLQNAVDELNKNGAIQDIVTQYMQRYQ